MNEQSSKSSDQDLAAASKKVQSEFLRTLKERWRLLVIKKKVPYKWIILAALILLGLMVQIIESSRRSSETAEVIATPPPTTIPIPRDPSPTPAFNPDPVGLFVTSPSGVGRVAVYRDSIAGHAKLELWDIEPRGSGYPQGLESTGLAVSLRLTEWTQPPGHSQGFSFNKAFTLEFDLTKTDLSGYDINRAVIAYWDEQAAAWRVLGSTLDGPRRSLRTDSFKLGDYELLAPSREEL